MEKPNKNINANIKNLLDRVIKGDIDIPDNSLILHLSQEKAAEIFTKRRIQIINTIKNKNPASVKELSELVGRRIQAVDRDLKLLEKDGIVSLIKKGRLCRPVVEKQVIIFPLVSPEPIEKLTSKNFNRIREELSNLSEREKEIILKDLKQQYSTYVS